MQTPATLLTNANFKGFLQGTISNGKLKTVCVLGMNCYSCPGAVGDCPIGVMQAVLNSRKYNFAFLHRRLLMRARRFVRKVYLRLAMCVRIHRGFAI